MLCTATRFRRSLFVVLGLVSCNSFAVDAAIVVTATRTAQTADETIAPVTIITADEIARLQYRDVTELLRFHAGLDVARNGGPGQATSVFLRGSESNHVLVMIDGVRINPGTVGSAAFQNIDPAMIERIEIVRGPRSTLYGSDAIGGVINIILRDAGDRTQFSVTRGSFDTQHISGGVQRESGNVRYGVTAGRQTTDGFSPRVESDIDRGFTDTNLRTYAGVQMGALDAELSHWQARGNSEYLEFDFINEVFDPIAQDFKNSVNALTLKAAPSVFWSSTLKLSQVRDEIDQQQSDDLAHTRRNVLDWQNDFALGEKQLLTAGITLSREHTEAISFGTEFDEHTAVNAVFLQDDISSGRHHLIVATRLTDHEAFGQHATGNVDYGFQLDTATRLTAGIGTAFRAPDSTDRFGFAGEPDLDPERSRQIELGLRRQLTSTQQLRINVFDNRIDDLIDINGDFTSLINIDKAHIRGIEARYDWQDGPWQLNLQAIAQDPEDQNTGEQLPRRARESYTATTGFVADEYSLQLQFLHTGERDDSAFNDLVLAAYTVINASAVWSFADDWTLGARIANLFDRDYETAGDYRSAERSYFMQISYSASASP